uniref:Rab5 GDP/GTP exchange factor n=1 Tax=Parastrongyloides trichosuri TaxID=131310 RepID=A0A0N4ZNS6_PARTI
MEDKRVKVHISEDQLKCRNGCGHYGTPQWKGLCSVCWKISQTEKKKMKDFAKNKDVLTTHGTIKGSNDAGLSGTFKTNFIKKSISTTVNSIATSGRNMLSPTSSIDSFSYPYSPPQKVDSQTLSSNGVRQRSLSPDSKKIMQNYTTYMKTKLPKNLAKDVDRMTSEVIMKLTEYERLGDEQSEIVQALYETLWDKLLKAANELRNTTTHIDVSECISVVEKVICVICYDYLIGKNTEEEVADVSLQQHIRSLHWVNHGFLDTELNFSKPRVTNLIYEAAAKLNDINVIKSTEGKLTCLIEGCEKILEALKESRDGIPASADEFLPGLIYVILLANPPLIQSNLKFISRFAHENRIIKGESGYYFTNLSCAIEYIKNMTCESLKMDQDVFNAYVSGKLLPPLNKDNCLLQESIRKVEVISKMTEELIRGGDELDARLDEFEDSIDAQRIAFSEEIVEFTSKHPSKDILEVIEELKLENDS